MLEVVTKLQGGFLKSVPQPLQAVISQELKQNFQSVKSSTQVGVGYALDIVYEGIPMRAVFCEALPTVLGVKNDEIRDHLQAVIIGKLLEIETGKKGFEPMFLAVDGVVVMGEAEKYYNKWVGEVKNKLDSHLNRSSLDVEPRISFVRSQVELVQENFCSEMKFLQTPSGHKVEVWVTSNPAKLAADHAKEIIDNNPNPAVLGLPTGKTPTALYQRLIELVDDGWTGLHNLVGVQLDEYKGASRFNMQSFYRFLDEAFFKQLPKELNAIHINPADEDRLAKYDDKIAQLGGMLICFLGIGKNGHIAFNEPSSKLDLESPTRIVTLSDITRAANFGRSDLGFEQAITIGLKSIIASKNIFLIANSQDKIDALIAMLTVQPSTTNPASLLIGHQGLKIFITPQLYDSLKS